MKRGEPSSAVRLSSRLLSTSDVSSSRLGPATTLSTASSEAPPAKTASVRNVRCSSSFEQRVAPVDRRGERPLPQRQVARAAGQERQALAEPVEDRLERQHARPRGGELDRERQPVELARDRLDVGAMRVDVEVGTRSRGAGGEEIGRVDLFERVEPVLVLGAEVQSFAARREHLHARAPLEQ